MSTRLLAVSALVLLLSAMVAAQRPGPTPEPCCHPDQFWGVVTGRGWDRNKHIAEQDFDAVWFDHVHGMTRVDTDVRVEGNKFNNESRFAVINHFREQKQYVIDHHAQHCTVHPLQGQLLRYCVPQEAEFQLEATIGGFLRVQAWTLVDHQKGFAYEDTLAVRDCIPVGNMMFNQNQGTARRQEWWDVSQHVDSRAFDVPKSCQQATEASLPVLDRLAASRAQARADALIERYVQLE